VHHYDITLTSKQPQDDVGVRALVWRARIGAVLLYGVLDHSGWDLGGVVQ
jgi:hypothetical protein